MLQHRPSVIVLATYFGQWPVWFPAFLLSSARNETIDWLFFTDCDIPTLPYKNIRFERTSLAQLNERATSRLGVPVQKGLQPQMDLRPAYGLIFDDYVSGYDFWGHCDVDVVWGNIRHFITDAILHDHDIVSCRKDFLAGHLTLWRNRADTNTLFRSIPAHREIFANDRYFNFDESIISTFIKAGETDAARKLRVYWAEQMVAWFTMGNTPKGWHWEDGVLFDARNQERVYLHYHHWKKHVKYIDFGIGDSPARFWFTDEAVRSRRVYQDLNAGREGAKQFAHDLPRAAAGRSRALLRVSKRWLRVRSGYWAQRLADHSIAGTESEYLPESGDLFLYRLNLRIRPCSSFLLEAYHEAVQLAERAGARFRTEEDELLVDVGGISAYLYNKDEVMLLKRLFVDGIYEFSLPSQAVVLDIAMDVGLAALYFARRPDITVVGYEPCSRVLERALRNFSLNPEIAQRILAVKVGAGPFSFRTIAGFLFEEDDASPDHGNELDDPFGPPFDYEEIELVDIAELIAQAARDYPERSVVLKLSTENSTYFIDGVSESGLLRRTLSSGQVELVRTMIVKWRDRPRGERSSTLAADLTDAGFAVLRLAPYFAGEGLLYATRTGHRPPPDELRDSLPVPFEGSGG